MKRLFLILVILIANITLSSYRTPQPTQAAGDWDAWLYGSASGKLYHIDATGATLQTVQLPASAGSIYSNTVALYLNGTTQYAAYVSHTPGNYTLSIFDLTTNTLANSYPLPSGVGITSLDFRASRFQFTPDGLNYMLSYYNETAQTWEIALAGTGTNSWRVFPASFPVFAPINAISDGILFPVPQLVYFVNDGTELLAYLTVIYLYTEGAPFYPAFQWNVDTATLTPNPAFSVLEADYYHGTGETVFAMPDNRLPSSDENFAYWQNNTLQTASLTQPPYPFYNVPSTSLFGAQFLENGNRVMTGMFTAEGTTSVIVIERSGDFVGSLPIGTSEFVDSRFGLPTGVIYTILDKVYYVETLGLGLDNGMLPADLVATMPEAVKIVEGSFSFAATTTTFTFKQLAEPRIPTNEESSVVTSPPTTVPTVTMGSGTTATGSHPGLRVNENAIVQTTEGDSLNVRNSPGGTLVGTFPNGTEVILLEGPVTVDGLNWWKVTHTSTTGWVVDYIDDVQTLIPWWAVPTATPGTSGTTNTALVTGIIWHDACAGETWNGDFRNLPPGCTNPAPATAVGNGTFDAGEVGISNVALSLFQGTCGASVVAFQTTVTDANGKYTFTNLPAGAYCIQIVGGVPSANDLTLGVGVWTAPVYENNSIIDEGFTLLEGAFLELNFGWDVQG